jgi:peptidoglycan/xylan/chitin deacetylase (PgdA/CDA1 family)
MPVPAPSVTAHHVVGPVSTRVGSWLGSGDHLIGGLRSVVGAFPAIITDVTGPPDQLEFARAGIPAGPAAAEAVAVRLRRAGAEVTCEPDGHMVSTTRELTDLCGERGRHAVQVVRVDPSLLPELQIGSWFAGGWRTRLLRRLALITHLAPARMPARLAADVAFWSGVRGAATADQWRRLTASYVVLCYHRLAGTGIPGQERWDVAPRALRRQLRLLRVLGWRPLTPDQLNDFHRDAAALLPRRRFVITADDGFAETVDEFTGYARHRPQIFAVTTAVGGRAGWFGDVELAGWDELRRLQAAGGVIGSHARHHLPLATLDDATVEDEVGRSLTDLNGRVELPVAVLAYPHGSHDLRVRAAAVRTGYAMAYTTQQGRNGAGTDPWCLRRVEPKIWDTTLSFCWKVVTGESPPGRWEHHLERRWRRRHGT